MRNGQAEREYQIGSYRFRLNPVGIGCWLFLLGGLAVWAAIIAAIVWLL